MNEDVDELDVIFLSFDGLDSDILDELALDEMDDEYVSSIDPRIYDRMTARIHDNGNIFHSLEHWYDYNNRK